MNHERVQELIDIQDIREAVMRSCRGVDRCDAALIASAYHADGQEERAGQIRIGADVIARALVDSLLQSMQSTSHNITTQSITVRGDRAGVESYSVGQHIAMDGRRLNTQARYIDWFEKRDGAWKISHRIAISEIAEFLPEPARGKPAKEARRDRSDPSYAALDGEA